MKTEEQLRGNYELLKFLKLQITGEQKELDNLIKAFEWMLT